MQSENLKNWGGVKIYPTLVLPGLSLNLKVYIYFVFKEFLLKKD